MEILLVGGKMELSNPIHEVAQMQVVGVVVGQPLLGPFRG